MIYCNGPYLIADSIIELTCYAKYVLGIDPMTRETVTWSIPVTPGCLGSQTGDEYLATYIVLDEKERAAVILRPEVILLFYDSVDRWACLFFRWLAYRQDVYGSVAPWSAWMRLRDKDIDYNDRKKKRGKNEHQQPMSSVW